MRKPSMGGRQHWVMLVDEATNYKKSFFLKNMNEQVEPIIIWIKVLGYVLVVLNLSVPKIIIS